MSDITGGSIGNAIWDKQMALGESARAADRKKAFLRTRMAPAVSHERGMDYKREQKAPKMRTPAVSMRRSR